MSTHLPPQLVVPEPQAPHLPCKQLWPPGQALAQAPQFFASLLVSTHEPPQSVAPAEQLDAHLPAEQTSPLAQALPQAPQFFGSTSVTTHTPPHSVVPAPHCEAQAPSEQTSPVAHALPQAPQFLGSRLGSTHFPPHASVPVPQPSAQLPAEHTSPGAQALPHAPQCFGSELVSTQLPPQLVWFAAQFPASPSTLVSERPAQPAGAPTSTPIRAHPFSRRVMPLHPRIGEYRRGGPAESNPFLPQLSTHTCRQSLQPEQLEPQPQVCPVGQLPASPQGVAQVAFVGEV